MRYYRLLRDLPDLKAGAIFELKTNGYTCKITKYSNGNYIGFPKKSVENNPEWFEEYNKQPEKTEYTFIIKCKYCGIENPSMDNCYECFSDAMDI